MPKSSEPRVKRVITYAEHQGNLVKCGIKSPHDNNTDHVGSLEYATTFGSSDRIVVIVEVDPADIVSVPSDCEFQKLRTCRYKVVGKYEGPLPTAYVEDTNAPYVEDEEDEEYEDLEEIRISMIEEATEEFKDANNTLATALRNAQKALAILNQAEADKTEAAAKLVAAQST